MISQLVVKLIKTDSRLVESVNNWWLLLGEELCLSPSLCMFPAINCNQCLNILLTAVPMVRCSIICSSKPRRVLE